MGRPSKGWQLRKRKGRPYSVRWTIDGKPSEPGLGTYDRAEAERLAAELYADAIRGQRRVARRAPARGEALETAAGEWLSSIATTIDSTTRETYALYAETHWARWPTIAAITEENAAEYARSRLGSVQASTVRKEISALRGFLAWCVEKGKLAQAPALPSIPKRAIGTKHKLARKTDGGTELSPAEVRRLLKELPVTAAKRWGSFPIRAFFVVLYETSLRPATVEALSVPEHWRPGQTHLSIPRELDKARDGRPVPLTRAAVQALTSAAPQKGIIFGAHDRRGAWEAAARRALDPHRADLVCRYDLRRGRITHWTEETDNLAGVQYLAGHKHISTTSKYVKASLRAAKAVVGGKKRR